MSRLRENDDSTFLLVNRVVDDSESLLCIYTITHWAVDSWIMGSKLGLQLR